MISCYSLLMFYINIFGTFDTAELAHYYLTNDSEYEVVAFTINKEYLKEDTFTILYDEFNYPTPTVLNANESPSHTYYNNLI